MRMRQFALRISIGLFILLVFIYGKKILYADTAINQTVNISAQVSPTQNFPGTSPLSSLGSGGGSASAAAPQPLSTAPASINLSGLAYASSTVKILKDGSLMQEAIADQNGNFKAALNNLNPGNYQISLYAVDPNGIFSQAVTLNSAVTPGLALNLDNIFLPPTILINFSAVKKGQALAASGFTNPNAQISVYEQPGKKVFNTVANRSGAYNLSLDSSDLAIGSYNITAKSFLGNLASAESSAATFAITEQGQPKGFSSPALKADLNGDNKVNIIDFSILLFYFGRPAPKIMDFDHSGTVDLTDLSILLYYWSG